MADSESLERSLSLLRATLEATADGILVVDLEGRAILHNLRFRELWGLTAEEIASWNRERLAVEALAERTADPSGFRKNAIARVTSEDGTTLDEVTLLDGRILERHSRPQLLAGEVAGRVWSFRDITDYQVAAAALRETEGRFRRLFTDSRQAVYLTRADGTFIEANPAALALFGLTESELRNRTSVDFYKDPMERLRFENEIARTGSVVDYPVQLRAADGREMFCLLTSTARRDGTGTVVGYEGIVQDVTDRRQAQEALRRSEQKFRALIENAGDTITILDGEGTILYESPSLERVLGYRPEDLVGDSVFQYVHPQDRIDAGDHFMQLLSTSGGMVRLDVRFLHANGEWRWMEVTGRNLLDNPAVKGVVVNARDITDRRAAEQQLLHDAFHDKLTELPNRALLLDRIRKLLARSQRKDAPPFSVLFLDVDRFKVVNDSLGHHLGDQLLTAIARRLQRCLRPGDTVARLGGDEFTMLLDGADRDESTLVAERIRQELELPFDLGGHEVYASVSIGIATSANGYSTPEEMLRDADLAMYSAKDQGRSRYELFQSSMRAQALERLAMETDLRHALERGEFRLRYQPIVSLETGELVGFEALIRWMHESRGELAPIEFLQAAEDTGLVVPMGWWVLEEVCRQAVAWSEEGRTVVPIRANVSAHQLAGGALADRVEDVLGQMNCPPEFLHLELTESTMMENAESTVRTLARLKRLGVGLAIDDFGTGYSSLSYLHRFPTDSVKIDHSFVSRMEEREDDRRLIRTVVDLAHDLGMRVIAEGIERDAQADMLRSYGCESGQGFLFGRPLTVEDASSRLLNGASASAESDG